MTLNIRGYFSAFAIFSAIALLAPIRAGDLPGYDDARYALVAKAIVQSGDWLHVRSNGYPDLEHPPFFEWMQAACFRIFGVSDPIAKLPAALCGLACILLVGWLGRRLTGSPLEGLLAMFVLATTAYFLKYSAHAMTDVPITFFSLAAICAYTLAREDDRWFLATGFFVMLALMTRGLTGLALPAIFGIDAAIARRPVRLRYAAAGLGIALLIPALWYAWQIHSYGQFFFAVHSAWLDREAFGALSPAWRRYTGLPEYAWMLAKSYWPWLPFMVAGAVAVVRRRERRLYLLLVWIAVFAVMCAAAKSRVLRYMLPAYPAFSILAAIAIAQFVPFTYIRNGLRVATPALAVLALAIAIFPPDARHADEIRPIAVAASRATPTGARVAFYDGGAPRFDEANQMQWYGSRNLFILASPRELTEALRRPPASVFVVDRETYRECFARRFASRIIARSGRLICFRIAPQ